MISNKEHLTKEGLIKIVSLKAAFNDSGLSEKLQREFPDLVPLAENFSPEEQYVEHSIKDPS